MNMRATGFVTGLLALLAGCGGGGGGGAAAPAGPTNGKPTVVFSIPDWFTVTTTDEFTFTVTVDDPEGDAVDVELLNVPPGLQFTPIQGATPPVVGTLTWHVHMASLGVQNLYVRATDDRGAFRTERLVVRVNGRGNGQGLQVGDVTGDGILDAVILDRSADISSVVDIGAIFVFAGRTLPASTPTATLTIPGAASGDRLGDVSQGTGVQLADVTGDGVLDIVAGAMYADVGATGDAGKILVWRGGGGLTGTPAPRATLTIPSGQAGDRLGYLNGGPGIEILDFTGDGIPDVVAGASDWDNGSTLDVGAIFLWAGGAGLAGTPAPRATLRVNNAVAGDRLGTNWWGWPTHAPLLFADVTGDGRLDLLVATPLADNGTTADAGAVYVWAAGPGFTGTQFPSSILRIGGAAAQDYVGAAASGRGVQVADVTGDGTPDIIVGASYVDAGTNQDAGAVYVWGGGAALTSTPSPLATLAVGVSTSWQTLGQVNGGDGIALAEVTGDGTLDVLVGASQWDNGATLGVGVVFVWAGGTAMTASSTPSPVATLRPPSGSQWEGFPNGTGASGIVFGDVTGDAVLDLVIASPFADSGATQDTGAVFVWQGGSTLTGTPSVRASLRVSGAVAFDNFGYGAWDNWARDVRVLDLTADGLADIVAAGAYVDGTVTDQGGVWVWQGGSGLTGTPSPLATLRQPNAGTWDSLGNMWNSTEMLCVDVTGDGAPDLVVGTPSADQPGVADAGAVFVWDGGTALSGTPAPLATLRRSGMVVQDYLGDQGGGPGVRVVDVNRDGFLDIVVCGRSLDVGGVQDAGGVLTFAGGPTLAGIPLPRATLWVPGAAAWDNLGTIWSTDGLVPADLTDDGSLDLLVGATNATVATVQGAGAVYLWAGGSTHVGQVTLRASFTAPTPVQWDGFGN